MEGSPTLFLCRCDSRPCRGIHVSLGLDVACLGNDLRRFATQLSPNFSNLVVKLLQLNLIADQCGFK